MAVEIKELNIVLNMVPDSNASSHEVEGKKPVLREIKKSVLKSLTKKKER